VVAEEFTTAAVVRLEARLSATTGIAMQQAVLAVALAGERQAKLNASSGAHRKGTKTPATRYETGPARISGNLVRSVTHDRVTREGTVFTTRIGVAGSAPYGKWVEKLGYEFMAPTSRFLKTIVVPVAEAAFRAAFRAR